MNFDESNNTYNDSQAGQGTNRLPLLLGLAGIAFGALSFGFVIANALGGSNTPASTDNPQSVLTTTPAPEGTSAPETTPPPAPIIIPPTSTPAVPPTPTVVPPTPTPTLPAITTPKFHDIFRAEGGTTSKNAATALPVRRLEATWNNSYIGCPKASCVRGRASVMTAVGPFGTGESPVASASVYNTFVAQRSTANLHMDVRWKGTLAAVVGANVNTGVEIEIIVSEIDPRTGKIVKAVPNMPYSVLSKELGLEAIQGVDILKLEDSRSVNISLKLDTGHHYRIDLKITCSTRAAFSLSATTCTFDSDTGFGGVEWTKQVVEFDTGICSPTQKGDGCIYQD